MHQPRNQQQWPGGSGQQQPGASPPQRSSSSATGETIAATSHDGDRGPRTSISADGGEYPGHPSFAPPPEQDPQSRDRRGAGAPPAGPPHRYPYEPPSRHFPPYHPQQQPGGDGWGWYPPHPSQQPPVPPSEAVPYDSHSYPPYPFPPSRSQSTWNGPPRPPMANPYAAPREGFSRSMEQRGAAWDVDAGAVPPPRLYPYAPPPPPHYPTDRLYPHYPNPYRHSAFSQSPPAPAVAAPKSTSPTRIAPAAVSAGVPSTTSASSSPVVTPPTSTPPSVSAYAPPPSDGVGGYPAMTPETGSGRRLSLDAEGPPRDPAGFAPFPHQQQQGYQGAPGTYPGPPPPPPPQPGYGGPRVPAMRAYRGPVGAEYGGRGADEAGPPPPPPPGYPSGGVGRGWEGDDGVKKRKRAVGEEEGGAGETDGDRAGHARQRPAAFWEPRWPSTGPPGRGWGGLPPHVHPHHLPVGPKGGDPYSPSPARSRHEEGDPGAASRRSEAWEWGEGWHRPPPQGYPAPLHRGWGRPEDAEEDPRRIGPAGDWTVGRRSPPPPPPPPPGPFVHHHHPAMARQGYGYPSGGGTHPWPYPPVPPDGPSGVGAPSSKGPSTRSPPPQLQQRRLGGEAEEDAAYDANDYQRQGQLYHPSTHRPSQGGPYPLRPLAPNLPPHLRPAGPGQAYGRGGSGGGQTTPPTPATPTASTASGGAEMEGNSGSGVPPTSKTEASRSNPKPPKPIAPATIVPKPLVVAPSGPSLSVTTLSPHGKTMPGEMVLVVETGNPPAGGRNAGGGRSGAATASRRGSVVAPPPSGGSMLRIRCRAACTFCVRRKIRCTMRKPEEGGEGEEGKPASLACSSCADRKLVCSFEKEGAGREKEAGAAGDAIGQGMAGVSGGQSVGPQGVPPALLAGDQIKSEDVQPPLELPKQAPPLLATTEEEARDRTEDEVEGKASSLGRGVYTSTIPQPPPMQGSMRVAFPLFETPLPPLPKDFVSLLTWDEGQATLGPVASGTTNVTGSLDKMEVDKDADAGDKVAERVVVTSSDGFSQRGQRPDAEEEEATAASGLWASMEAALTLLPVVHPSCLGFDVRLSRRLDDGTGSRATSEDAASRSAATSDTGDTSDEKKANSIERRRGSRRWGPRHLAMALASLAMAVERRWDDAEALFLWAAREAIAKLAAGMGAGGFGRVTLPPLIAGSGALGGVGLANSGAIRMVKGLTDAKLPAGVAKADEEEKEGGPLPFPFMSELTPMSGLGDLQTLVVLMGSRLLAGRLKEGSVEARWLTMGVAWARQMRLDREVELPETELNAVRDDGATGKTLKSGKRSAALEAAAVLKETRRRVWWFLFLLDTLFSTTFNTFPAISEDEALDLFVPNERYRQPQRRLRTKANVTKDAPSSTNATADGVRTDKEDVEKSDVPSSALLPSSTSGTRGHDVVSESVVASIKSQKDDAPVKGTKASASTSTFSEPLRFRDVVLALRDGGDAKPSPLKKVPEEDSPTKASVHAPTLGSAGYTGRVRTVQFARHNSPLLTEDPRLSSAWSRHLASLVLLRRGAELSRRLWRPEVPVPEPGCAMLKEMARAAGIFFEAVERAKRKNGKKKVVPVATSVDNIAVAKEKTDKPAAKAGSNLQEVKDAAIVLAGLGRKSPTAAVSTTQAAPSQEGPSVAISPSTPSDGSTSASSPSPGPQSAGWPGWTLDGSSNTAGSTNAEDAGRNPTDTDAKQTLPREETTGRRSSPVPENAAESLLHQAHAHTAVLLAFSPRWCLDLLFGDVDEGDEDDDTEMEQVVGDGEGEGAMKGMAADFEMELDEKTGSTAQTDAVAKTKRGRELTPQAASQDDVEARQKRPKTGAAESTSAPAQVVPVKEGLKSSDSRQSLPESAPVGTALGKHLSMMSRLDRVLPILWWWCLTDHAKVCRKHVTLVAGLWESVVGNATVELKGNSAAGIDGEERTEAETGAPGEGKEGPSGASAVTDAHPPSPSALLPCLPGMLTFDLFHVARVQTILEAHDRLFKTKLKPARPTVSTQIDRPPSATAAEDAEPTASVASLKDSEQKGEKSPAQALSPPIAVFGAHKAFELVAKEAAASASSGMDAVEVLGGDAEGASSPALMAAAAVMSAAVDEKVASHGDGTGGGVRLAPPSRFERRWWRWMERREAFFEGLRLHALPAAASG
ncbi:hypothetical protein HDU96_002126 [Phlyctochytrium bullatum]|nr:hypothetical protein HDU96_002126 [Phlyctochytrium bullatum]